MKHYWAQFEFAKSRGQIHFHLVGIIEGSTNPGGIQHQLFINKENRSLQAKILADWARTTFNMTAETKSLENHTEKDKKLPCSVYLSQSLNIEDDQQNLLHFYQIHNCSDYCL